MVEPYTEMQRGDGTNVIRKGRRRPTASPALSVSWHGRAPNAATDNRPNPAQRTVSASH